uniref:Four F5 protein n=1 Tax=Echinococcus granulosus TaxID=6210 RepID=A0A068X0E3_ECHGR|nr:Four F5 protein [Echinococcus granulosus]
MTRGNQRELARQKNQQKQKENQKKVGSKDKAGNKGLTLEERTLPLFKLNRRRRIASCSKMPRKSLPVFFLYHALLDAVPTHMLSTSHLACPIFGPLKVSYKY